MMRRQQILLYSIAQALALTGAVIAVSISPLVGKTLAPSPEYSTLPYGVQFAAVIFCSYILSMAMKRYGRRLIFMVGCCCFAAGGVLGALSMMWSSFTTNLFAHMSFGVALSAFAYFRFAATDGLDSSNTAKAVSMVTLGGIVAAFIAPLIAQNTRMLIPEHAFAASYLCFTGLAVLLAFTLMFVPSVPANQDKKEPEAEDEAASTFEATLDTTPKTTPKVTTKSRSYKSEMSLAIYASGFGYMLMALLMMQSSLKMNAMGVEFGDIMFVIQCHVIAMFLPSLFMGRVIAMVGVGRVIMGGYIMMFAAMLIAIQYDSYHGILVALIGIGLGWNMLYVGGSALVASLPGDAHKLQGINESAVAFLNTLGAFSAGFLFQTIGWENSNLVSMVLLLPGLVLLVMGYMKKSQKL